MEVWKIFPFCLRHLSFPSDIMSCSSPNLGASCGHNCSPKSGWGRLVFPFIEANLMYVLSSAWLRSFIGNWMIIVMVLRDRNGGNSGEDIYVFVISSFYPKLLQDLSLSTAVLSKGLRMIFPQTVILLSLIV